MNSEERIRRAEEIYNRRRMQNGVRVSTSKISSTTNYKFKLYKKLILQIVTCLFIYIIFYLVKNSNYIFSQDFIKKTKEFLEYDINFTNIYNSATEYYNNNIKSFFNPITDNSNINNEETSSNSNFENNIDEQESTNQTGGIGGGQDEIISAEDNNKTNEPEILLSQMEIDANEIKSNYSFIIPLKGVISSRFRTKNSNSHSFWQPCRNRHCSKYGNCFCSSNGRKSYICF